MRQGWTRFATCTAICHNYISRRNPTRITLRARCRALHSTAPAYSADVVPLRKQLKDAAKAVRTSKRDIPDRSAILSEEDISDWELTVGIEIHAQLNTARKLFSPASTEPAIEPNTRLSQFDVSLPGSQPKLQYATLIPAIRAALALGCEIQPVSRFDRKHYFYHDQPAGYQITQYYFPFAKDGEVILNESDGLSQGQELVVGIKQVQMEQDTARTQEQDSETSLIDFNRAGHPLIEIISLPHIHSPRAAAAYVRKVQALLSSVDAVTTGMELGGMRADVNVSVRRINDETGQHSYGGVTGLGQRTEIKNIGTIKGVEDAVKAERDRQIAVLEAGGNIEGETRGWSITDPTVTRRLRGKEGEVDYRYMPDPDIPPLYIGHDTVDHLSATLPPSPENLAKVLVTDYGLLEVDAKSLMALDEGGRLIYFQEVVDKLQDVKKITPSDGQAKTVGRVVGNWVLHELGSLLSADGRPWTPDILPSQAMARIVSLVGENKITGTSAKKILRMIYENDGRSVDEIVEQEGLSFVPLTIEEYDNLASRVIASHPQHVKDIQEKGKIGKLQFLVGQMMKEGEKGRIQAESAEDTLRRKLLGR